MSKVYPSTLFPSNPIDVLGLSVVQVAGHFEVSDPGNFTVILPSPSEALALIWEARTVESSEVRR